MNNIRVLFFATIMERIGVREINLQISEKTDVGELKKILGERYPEIVPNLSSLIVAINREFAFDDELIPENAEIAIFPPVSGGSQSNNKPTIITITEKSIATDELISQIKSPITGAACIFSGFVRGKTTRGKERETEYLEYDAYLEMAMAKMQKVVDEIRQQWPSIFGIAVVQRIGRLEPGTPTVLIACTAAHRDTGIFEATRYGIDRLKEIVPVWKKEVGPGGEVWIEGEYSPKPGE
jgi:molybdopterin converting factor subunit 1